LARDDGGAGVIAILEDLEEIAALRVLHRGEAPVVDQEDVEPGELAEQADVGAVGANVALVCWGVVPSGMLRHPVMLCSS
jgi:hypothetical protein